MKHNLIYSYTTAAYHVYICSSRDPNKNGAKFYLPRCNSYDLAKIETDVIISEPPKNTRKVNKKSEEYAQLVFRIDY
jgi:hypothetical protein